MLSVDILKRQWSAKAKFLRFRTNYSSKAAIGSHETAVIRTFDCGGTSSDLRLESQRYLCNFESHHFTKDSHQCETSFVL